MVTLVDITHRIVVDGIESVRGYDAEGDDPSLYIRRMFELRCDHPYNEVDCNICAGLTTGGDSYIWRKGMPIVRFTSSGLEVS